MPGSFGELTGNPGLDALIDPTGFLRTLKGGGNPLSGDPFGLRGPGGELLPTVEAQELFISQVFNSTLSDADKEAIRLELAQNPESMVRLRQLLEDQERQIADDAILEEARLKAELFTTENLGALTTLEGRILPGLEAGISRFTGGGGQLSANFVSNDEEFGAILGEGERAINANVNRARQNASISNVNAGVASSGKTSGQVGQAESAAAGKRGSLRGSLSVDALVALQAARDRRDDFTTGLTNARIGVRSGALPNFTNLASLGTAPAVDFGAPRDTRIDERFGQSGVDLANAGFIINTGTGIAGLADNAFNSTLGRLIPNRAG